MDYIENKDVIVIFSKKIGLTTLASKLADLNAEQINGFFQNRSIKLPRKLNMMALFGALNERIKTLNSHSLSRDGFIKLGCYPEFNESLLESLFEKIAKEDDFAQYRKNLWALILRNFKGLHLLDGEANYLNTIRKQKMESPSNFFKQIHECEIDMENDFDAIKESNLEDLMKKCFSQDDVRRLAAKYNIIIPNRLKKEELVVYVCQVLDSKRRLTKTLEKELNEMTVVQLNSFCKLHQIELSANLKKNEVIFLFLFLLRKENIEKLPNQTWIPYDWAAPLEFTVDIDAVDSFNRFSTPKKVIILKNQAQETRPESIIPIRVEGLDVLLDLEHGTILPDPNAGNKNKKTKVKSVEEAPVEEEPTEEELEEELVEEELEEEPAEEELEEELAEEELEEEPAEEELEEEPAEEELEEEPAEEELEEEPAEEELEEEPVEEELEEEPVEEELEEEPAEEELEEEPAEEELEEEPAEEELEEEPAEEELEEEQAEEELEEEPAEEELEEELAEEELEEEPAEEELEEEPAEEELEEEPAEEELEEEPAEEELEEEEPTNESYDPEFEDISSEKLQKLAEDSKENMFFRNKKLLSKKKTIIVSVVAVLVIAVVIGGVCGLFMILGSIK